MKIRSEINYITLVGLSLSVALAAGHSLPADAVVLCRHNAFVYLVSDCNPYEAFFSNYSAITATVSDLDERKGYTRLNRESSLPDGFRAIKPVVRPEIKRNLQLEKLVVDCDFQPLYHAGLYFSKIPSVITPGCFGWSAIALTCIPVRAGPSTDLCFAILA